MKSLLLFLLLVAPVWAQWIVNDPVNTAVNTAVQTGQAANHLAILKQWAQQVEQLNRQLRELQNLIEVQQRIRDVLGDPDAAGAGMVLRELGAKDLAREYGETLAAVRRLSNAVESLRRTSDGIYRGLEDRTSLGAGFARDETFYRRFAAVDRQADNLAAVQGDAATRRKALQAEVASTLAAMKAAKTQAEVDKLAVQLSALNGQLSQMDARWLEEAEKLRAQQTLNENQAAKERQDLLERQVAEERQSLGVIGRWQESLKLKPTEWRK